VNIIYLNIQYFYKIEFQVILDILINLFIIIVIIFNIYIALRLVKAKRSSYDRSFLEIQEFVFLNMIEIVRLKINLLEFPHEEEFKKKIPEIRKKLKESKLQS